MPLRPGSRLGAYELLAPLGTGGMGEVYRARDTRLGREVAIKVLPADRLDDEQGRRRFVQEAKTASSLSNPHIVTIFEIESEADVDFIVMEYVSGRSLDAAIPRHGLRLPELLRIALPVTDALAAAHASGIVHRDLKPANVMVGDSGAVKVLDFGLAKLVDGDLPPDGKTVTRLDEKGLSSPGAIVGTAAYMAPEQATGGKVDARSDIFSFGAMLYEMATGVRAFGGSSVVDTLAAVVRAQPTPPSQLVPEVPRELERVILHCLRKEPDRRYQTAVDLRNALLEIKEESESGTPGITPVSQRGSPWRTAVLAASALVVVAAIGSVAWLLRPRRAVDLPPARVVPLTSSRGEELWPSLSPDGEQVAFSWDDNQEGQIDQGHFDIYLKLVGSSDVRRLTTDPGRNWVSSWSPDGRQIACLRESAQGETIFLVSPVTGAERKLLDFPGATRPFPWTPDGQGLIVARDPRAETGGGIYYIPVNGGTPRLLLPKPGSVGFLYATVLAPDGHRLAYFACESTSYGELCDLDVVELDERWQPTSSPRRLASHLRAYTGMAWSRDGASLLYSVQAAPATLYLWRAWVDGDRAPERIELAGLGARMPTVAASRDRLAFTRYVNAIGVYTLGVEPRPVLVSSMWDIQPQFSPDGTRLVFASSRSGEGLDIWVAAADGSNPRQLTHGPGLNQGSPAWSPDGRRIAFDSADGNGRLSVWLVDADGGVPQRITEGPGDQNMPTWSRDGRWIYFSVNEGTGPDNWRVPSTGGPAERITRGGGGFFAVESMDGRELVYKPSYVDSPLVALPLTGGPPRRILPCVHGQDYAVTQMGIYYAECGPGPQRSLRLLDTTGRDRILGGIRDTWEFGLERLAVAPDGRTVLVQQQTVSNDLVLIENFR